MFKSYLRVQVDVGASCLMALYPPESNSISHGQVIPAKVSAVRMIVTTGDAPVVVNFFRWICSKRPRRRKVRCEIMMMQFVGVLVIVMAQSW